jgi:hypothetical protein
LSKVLNSVVNYFNFDSLTVINDLLINKILTLFKEFFHLVPMEALIAQWAPYGAY